MKNINGEEDAYPRIYDVPEEKCIDMEFDLYPGATYTLRMSDVQAQRLINILQNKLNGRFE